MSDTVIGPVLPNTFVKDGNEDTIGPCFTEAKNSEVSTSVHIGPMMPPGLFESADSTVQDDDDCKPSSIGPCLPPSVAREKEGDGDDEECSSSIGPALPPGVSLPTESDEEDDDVIGPTIPQNEELAQIEYYQRLLNLKAQQDAEKNAPKREEWMTQLPKKLGSYGLGARQFSKSTAPAVEQSSEWTETPDQKRRRLADGSSSSTKGANNVPNARDLQEQQRAEEFNKNRGDALLDQHQKKKGIVGTTESGGRKAFNIEQDMAVRGLGGNKSTEELKEQCGELSSRFGHAKTQKFL